MLNGSIISYDEGLINGDRELAAALWRTFFQRNCTDYRKLEVLVQYVRIQVSLLFDDLEVAFEVDLFEFCVVFVYLCRFIVHFNDAFLSSPPSTCPSTCLSTCPYTYPHVHRLIHFANFSIRPPSSSTWRPSRRRTFGTSTSNGCRSNFQRPLNNSSGFKLIERMRAP